MSERDEEDKNEREFKAEGGGRWWQEMMREVTLTGMATFFMTEDSIRNYLKERKLPKELVGLLLDGIGKKKDDFYALMAKEVGQMLSKVDLTREVSRFLEKHKIHFEAKVSFERKASHEIKKHGGEK